MELENNVIIKNNIKEKNFKKIFLCFIFYSVLGWIYEVFLEVFIYKWGFTNRGILFGPYCPVYGFGSLILIRLFSEKIKRKLGLKDNIKYVLFVFFASAFIATLIELVSSYILEYFTGSWPWQTYVDYAINFQGRIALSTSVRFGLGALAVLYFIQPMFNKFVLKLNEKSLKLIFRLVFLLFIADFIYLIINTFFKI